MLTEVAPGVDLERDVFANMAFRPAVAAELKTMDPAMFLDAVRAVGVVGA